MDEAYELRYTLLCLPPTYSYTHIFVCLPLIPHPLSPPRCSEGGRPHRGPSAIGLRMQQTLDCRLPGTGPAKLSASGAYMSSLPGGALSGGMDPMAGDERDVCFGGNLELIAELQRLLGCR